MMNLLDVIYFLAGAAITVFFGAFCISSIIEKKSRAALLSGLASVAAAGFWFGIFFFCPIADSLILPSLIGVGIVAGLYFGPVGTRKVLRVGQIACQVDERDTAFAREEYEPGTEKYKTYYASHPEYKDVDDRIRALPMLLQPGGRYYDAERSEKIIGIFRQIKQLTTRVDGDPADKAATVDPPRTTADIKRHVLQLGADEVGVAVLNPMHVYSHVGRGPEPWGAPIENNHEYAICFTLEMDYHRVEQAPTLPTVEETAHQYLRAAEMSVSLAKYIRSCGYSARAHISDSNYQIILPAVAHDAGLGELGRCGYLISSRYGARVRLGGVTTDMPLVADRPIDFGVQDFCEKCRKCAVNCPAAAIPIGSRTEVRGVEKWPMDVEQCLRYWRLAGTDCGLCMKVCPFSHPSTLVHNIIKSGIKRSAFARTVSLWGDDLFYGRKTHWDKL